LGWRQQFDDPNFIGKFGFGLPNASINQTRKIDLYTWTKKNERAAVLAPGQVSSPTMELRGPELGGTKPRYPQESFPPLSQEVGVTR
jgi:hypothetical protein